jgi:hypothetical protein
MARLAIAQFDYVPDRGALKVCQPGKSTVLARIVRDTVVPGMWRVVRPDGKLSDMVNLSRAKDVAFGIAETALYLRSPAEKEPAENGHFFKASASPVRSFEKSGREAA